MRVLTHLLDEGVDSSSGLDEEHDAPGLLQLGHHLLHRVRAHDLRPLGLVGQEPEEKRAGNLKPSLGGKECPN